MSKFGIIKQVIKDAWRGFRLDFLASRYDKYAYKDRTAIVLMPSIICKNNVYLYEHTTIGEHSKIQAAHAKFIMKRNSIASFSLTAICDNHLFFTPGTYPSGPGWSNGESKDIIIDEGVWIGANVTLLAGVHIGRGCIVAAGSVCLGNREYPPYTVIAGVPAKVIKFRFSLEDQFVHENMVFSEDERINREVLRSNFERISEQLKK